MLRFRRAEIHVRGCGSSTDPEVKASYGRPSATCHLLRVALSIPDRLCGYRTENKPTFFLVQFAYNFLHNFYHPVRFSIGMVPPSILKHT